MRDLTSSLAYCLEVARADTTAAVVGPLRQALVQFGTGLLAVYAPEVPLDLVARQGTPPLTGPVTADSAQAYRPLGLPELLALPGGLESFPPLAVYLRVVEVLGVLALPERPDRGLGADGKTAVSRRLSTRGLLLGSLRRLTQRFRAAFPEAPGLSDPAGEAVSFDLLPQWSAAFTPQAVQLIPPLQHEATALGFCEWWLQAASQEVSWKSRLAFWSSTPQKERAAALKAERRQRQARAHELWGQLLEESARAASTLPALALRDAILQVQTMIPAISTDPGKSSSACHCRVLHREPVEEQLAHVRGIFRDRYGLAAGLGDFMRELSRPGPCAQGLPPTLGLGPVGQPVLLGALRARCRLLGQLPRLEQLRSEHAQVNYERQVVDSQIGFWDRVNVFRQTPQKERRGELTRAQQQLKAELEQLTQAVAADFFQAAEIYPPLVIHLLTGPVEAAVAAIQASCSSTTSRRDRDGESETSYECELSGQPAAIQAAREWASEFSRLFGALPGPARLLELWAG